MRVGSMLDLYIGEYMTSLYNIINNGIKNLPDHYQNCDTAQILILGEYHKM